jgi:hypothetical protein
MHPDYIMFSDPGDESGATYKHMEWLTKYIKEHGIEYIRVSAGNIYDDVMKSLFDPNIKRIAQPPFVVLKDNEQKETLMPETNNKGVLMRKCTTEYKIDPMTRKVREMIGLKKGQRFPRGFVCNKMLGISLDEVQRMKPSKNKWEVIHWPLIDMRMTRWDCYNWLEKNGYKIPPRSACLMCPFHSDSYWRDMKNNNPDEFEHVCVLDDNLRIGNIPGVNGTVYLHRSCTPLRDVDLSNDIDNGQMQMWKNECEGFCGT